MKEALWDKICYNILQYEQDMIQPELEYYILLRMYEEYMCILALQLLKQSKGYNPSYPSHAHSIKLWSQSCAIFLKHSNRKAIYKCRYTTVLAVQAV